MKMEDYVKILLLKMLGQSSAVTFKSLFSKPRRSTCFNKMCFLFNECKRGHRKGLEASNIEVSAVCHVSTAPTTTAAGCPYVEHRSPQTCASSHLHFGPHRRPTKHGALCHRKNYSLSDFPVSLNLFYLQLQHHVKKADRNHPTSH